MSNYPAGAEFDPNAPYNQPDAKPEPYWVTLSVRIDAIDSLHAVQQVQDWLILSKINGAKLISSDWEVDGAIKDE